jgi:hypothetical protein
MNMERSGPIRGNTLRNSVGATSPATAPPPRNKRPGRRVLRLLLLGATFFTLIIACVRSCDPAEPLTIPPVVEAPKPVDCKAYPFKNHGIKLKDRLPDYKELSLKAGLRPIADEKALEQYLNTGGKRLVRVQDNAHFVVARMDHGKPYLTPAAHDALLSIARDFSSRIADTDLAGTRLKVTSLFRTRKDQRDLGRKNVNATKDLDAPHTHGTSMDISYSKFMSKDGEQLALEGCQQVFLAETLAEVIAEHRKKDRQLFATREVKQACYHLSVCRPRDAQIASR